MTKLLKICVLGFMALGFVACDEVSNAVESATKEGKKIAQALSIEQPLLGADISEYDFKQTLYIQSQDNNTTIEDIIINRGNCGVIKYVKDDDKASAYRESHPKLGYDIKLKNGETMFARTLITDDIFKQLDTDSKSIYKPIFPKKLAYGKKFSPNYDCAIDDIIEVEIIVNGGGSIVYKPKEMLLF